VYKFSFCHPGKEIRDVSKYSPVYFGEKLNKEEIMEMMGVEFERKIREIFAATEVRQHEKKFICPLIRKGALSILTYMDRSVPGFSSH
jgi:hypothetical protein